MGGIDFPASPAHYFWLGDSVAAVYGTDGGPEVEAAALGVTREAVETFPELAPVVVLVDVQTARVYIIPKARLTEPT